MSNAPFLLVSAVPLPDLARILSRGRGRAALSSDFRAAARTVLEPGAYSGVVLADLPRGARQDAALRVLDSLRSVDRTLPAALVTDAPAERLIRAAARGRATVLLTPIRPAEVARFTNDLARAHPVRAGIELAARWFLRGCDLSPESLEGRLLVLRARGRTAHEACHELGVTEKKHWRLVGALTSASGVPRLATIVSLVLRRAQDETVPWEPPQAVDFAECSALAAKAMGQQNPK
ncbi:MAG: hypothetical protein IT379_42070 [Deltaproteobacteria bacterium]|nr:hypothetical protein [Deltaproteobacteria bacterium]